MAFLFTLSALGLLQSLMAVASSRSKWPLTVLLCLMPGLVVLGMQSRVAEVNFIRLTDLLMEGNVAGGLAILLFLESLLKAFCMLDKETVPGAGMHRVHIWMAAATHAVERVVQALPSLMFLFFLFYSQCWLFHTVERVSFSLLSLGLAAATSLFLGLGTLILRALAPPAHWEGVEYDLLFLQFVLAIIFPLIGSTTPAPPRVYDSSIYFQAATTAAGILLLTSFGFAGHLLQKKRHP